MDNPASAAHLDGVAAHPIDRQAEWASGSVHLRTMPANGRCERTVIRHELAIGICFQKPGSRVQWLLDGRPVLDKMWTSGSGSRDLIILPPGREFVGRCRGNGQGLWVFIEPQSIRDLDRISAFLDEPRIDCSWAKDRLSWAIATELRNECDNGFPRGAMFLESAATALLAQLAYVFHRAAPRNEPIGGLRSTNLRLVVEYIESNLDRNITLSELAALVQLTPRYFCAAFKQAMGRPPHQFQIEQRVERAKTLLCQVHLSLPEVALMVGFSSQSHLNEYFRRIVGVTPARYRAAILQNRHH
jgi:AraC family transcriptional regulator